MQTRIVTVTEKDISDKDRDALDKINKAGDILKSGGLVAFPTETVYGLGGDAFNPGSSKKIYGAKGRPSDNPLIVHIADRNDLYRLSPDVPDGALKLTEKFWPGPLTIILKKKEDVPYETTGGLDTVAIRMPSNMVAAALIRSGGGFIAAPSANRSGRPSPTKVEYVIEDLDGSVDMIIDGGSSVIGLESTIVDLSCKEPVILRPGAITLDDVRSVLPDAVMDPNLGSVSPDQRPKAPGMKYRHYAPKGDLTLVRGTESEVTAYINRAISDIRTTDKNKITAVIATDETSGGYDADIVKKIGSRSDHETIARNLFTILRELDDEGAEVIFAESLKGDGIISAVMNRLLKAAGQKEVIL